MEQVFIRIALKRCEIMYILLCYYCLGLLSSFGELEYACCDNLVAKERPVIVPWEPDVAAETSYPITSYQPKYFVAERYVHASIKSMNSLEYVVCPMLRRKCEIFVIRYLSRSTLVTIS